MLQVSGDEDLHEGHKEPQRTTENHREPQRTTENHKEPQRTTKNHREPQRTTENHREPQRTTENVHVDDGLEASMRAQLPSQRESGCGYGPLHYKCSSSLSHQAACTATLFWLLWTL
ncbi:hypothetical protein EYF80_066516 [Liparis tanakae]|uniref:Uncharacterized protein n=1 Tax=Liparis tanakae TaxID=230148 RepID=A0A4Z2E407_9TELE|nr:hypothetical protein EYF80_066516 [Liparis tanakae]